MSKRTKKSASFFGKKKRSESEAILRKIAIKVCSTMQDRIVAATLMRSFDRNELHLYPDYDPSLARRLSLRDFRLYRQVLALRSKSDDVDLGIDKEAVAWAKYCEAETLCRSTNERMADPRSWEKILPGAHAVFEIAARKISEILGPCPELADLRCRFGPGANVSCRNKTTARHKLSSQLGCSVESLEAIASLKDLYPLLFKDREVVVEEAEVSMAPKNAKTFRTVEFQPLLNTFVQLGIGSWMKGCLMRAGINLYSQIINRERARSASLDGKRATVDWSSASDTIALLAVFRFLEKSEGWFDLLYTWRTGRVRYRKGSRVFSQEKFSAMGNGYTFELESLIFWALAFAVCKFKGIAPDISIYGDDLIVPTEAVEPIFEYFKFFGFIPNREKSFWDGPFRESCGGDYLSGSNVRPFYVKSRLTAARLVALHNHFYRSWEFSLASYIEDFIPDHLRLYGPDGFGDGHLVSNVVSPKRSSRARRSGWSGGSFATFAKVPRRETGNVSGDWKLPAYQAYLAESSPGVWLPFGSLPFDSIPLRFRTDWLRANARALDRADALSVDPYVLRGGERSRKVTVYTLTL